MERKLGYQVQHSVNNARKQSDWERFSACIDIGAISCNRFFIEIQFIIVQAKWKFAVLWTLLSLSISLSLSLSPLISRLYIVLQVVD